MRHDTSLDLPTPGAVGAHRLEGPGDAVAYAGRARRVPVVLATARARIEADELRGIGAVMLDGRPALDEVATDAPPAAGVQVGPRSLRREMVGPGGTILETAVVAERFAGAAIQWSGDGAEGLSLRCRLPRSALAWNAAEGVLRVDLDDGRVVLGRAAPAAEWTVEAAEGGDGDGHRAVATTSATTLLVAAGKDADEAGAALAALGRLRAVDVRAARAVERLGREGLVLDTGVPELDGGVAWARARLEAWTGGAPPVTAGSGPTDPSATTGSGGLTGSTGLTGPLADAVTLLGVLAGGERRSTRDPGGSLVARLLDPEGPGGDRGARSGTRGTRGTRAEADCAALLAAGWLATWAGDAGPAERHRPVLTDAARRLLADPAGLGLALARAAARGWADALDALGDRDAAGRLRQDAEGARPPGRTSGGKALPMAGRRRARPADASPKGYLAAALDPEANAPPPPTDPGPGAAAILAAWSAWSARSARSARSSPDAAYLLFREGLGAAGDEASAPFLADPGTAALVPVALLVGMLGVTPDAPFGRLRISPRLPSSWSRFRIAGLGAGDASLELLFHREKEGARIFELRPTGGRAPMNVALEPLVPGPVGRVLVDGAPAEVDRFMAAGRTGIRLQLPVDRKRTVTLCSPSLPGAS